MYLRRVWNSWAPYELRHVTPMNFALTLFIIFTLTFLVVYNLDLTFILASSSRGLCFNELSLQRARFLNASERVRIIPSGPRGKLRGYVGGNGDNVNEENMEEDLLSNPCITIPAPPFASSEDSVIICIHDPEKDKIVSGHLKRTARWERENVEALYLSHTRHPDMMLVDLGCNIGVFTLPAARLGMQVLAVDAMMPSLRLLQKSLFINGLSCQVTLIHNALYRRRMRMRVALDPSNVGASRVVEIMESRKDKVAPKDLVDAICLDDLIPFVKGREVFLKMDLEASEDAVLECSDRFFTEVNVKVLMIEWLYFRHQEKQARAIMDFLFRHGMHPTWGVDSDRDIDVRAAHMWPDNVFWMKTT